MLYYIAKLIQEDGHQGLFSYFRIFTSYVFLLGLGGALAFFMTMIMLPRWWSGLPNDRGKALAVAGDAAKGKPTGAGLIFVSLATLTMLLTVPLSWESWYLWAMVACLYLAMLSGYFDDASLIPWPETPKLLLDIGIAFLAAYFFSCRSADTASSWFSLKPQTMAIWFPFLKQIAALPSQVFGFVPDWLACIQVTSVDDTNAHVGREIYTLALSPWLYLPLATLLLLLAINSTNCSDGVDSLAGLLSALSLVYLGLFLYVVVGHEEFSRYLLVPHHPAGSRWAVIVFCSIGALCGYIWHNAFPSAVLMGDAGSRFLGLLIGISVLISGNPLMILAVAPMLVANGGTGLVKLLILRALNKCGFDTTPPHKHAERLQADPGYRAPPQIGLVAFLHSIRFPLHDHCRKNLGWSPTQVVVRFLLIQALLTPVLFMILVKLR